MKVTILDNSNNIVDYKEIQSAYCEDFNSFNGNKPFLRISKEDFHLLCSKRNDIRKILLVERLKRLFVIDFYNFLHYSSKNGEISISDFVSSSFFYFISEEDRKWVNRPFALETQDIVPEENTQDNAYIDEIKNKIFQLFIGYIRNVHRETYARRSFEDRAIRYLLVPFIRQPRIKQINFDNATFVVDSLKAIYRTKEKYRDIYYKFFTPFYLLSKISSRNSYLSLKTSNSDILDFEMKIRLYGNRSGFAVFNFDANDIFLFQCPCIDRHDLLQQVVEPLEQNMVYFRKHQDYIKPWENNLNNSKEYFLKSHPGITGWNDYYYSVIEEKKKNSSITPQECFAYLVASDADINKKTEFREQFLIDFIELVRENHCDNPIGLYEWMYKFQYMQSFISIDETNKEITLNNNGKDVFLNTNPHLSKEALEKLYNKLCELSMIVHTDLNTFLYFFIQGIPEPKNKYIRWIGKTQQDKAYLAALLKTLHVKDKWASRVFVDDELKFITQNSIQNARSNSKKNDRILKFQEEILSIIN